MPTIEITLNYLYDLRRALRDGIIGMLAIRGRNPFTTNGKCFPIPSAGEAHSKITQFMVNLDEAIADLEVRNIEPNVVLAVMPDTPERVHDIWVKTEPRTP